MVYKNLQNNILFTGILIILDHWYPKIVKLSRIAVRDEPVSRCGLPVPRWVCLDGKGCVLPLVSVCVHRDSSSDVLFTGVCVGGCVCARSQGRKPAG